MKVIEKVRLRQTRDSVGRGEYHNTAIRLTPMKRQPKCWQSSAPRRYFGRDSYPWHIHRPVGSLPKGENGH
jgi:hypothetical protein